MGTTRDMKSPVATLTNWVEQYSDNLYSWAYYRTSNKEIAEDLVQDTFMAAFHSLEKFNWESNPKTWLMSILKNKISDFFREQYKTSTANQYQILETLFDQNGHWRASETPRQWQVEDEKQLLDNLDFRQILLDCLDKLPKNWFAAINLKFLEEKKGKEICQELGITDTNFWQILHRAKLQLRKCLELNWFKT